MSNYEPCQIQSCIDHIKTALDVDPWAKLMCENVMRRAIPVKPTGHEGYMKCGVCGTRVRSGVPHSAKDTVCRNCFTVIDWD